MANASEADDVPFLPISEVTKILTDEQCPKISICIPCYKRQKFVPLILCNLIHLDYPPDKIEVNILQDGEVDLFKNKEELEFFKEKLKPATLQYKYEKDIRRSIGEKRNKLVKSSANKIILMMDSDDIYFPTYARYSVSALKQYKVGIVGSAQMMFLYPKMDYKITGIRCGYLHQIHEATMCFTKRHHGQMGGFVSRGKDSNMGEGAKMVCYNEKNTLNLDIRMIMCCCAHDGEEGNTVPKDRFSDANMNGEFKDLPQLEILKGIFNQGVNI
jgi:glycosyltransferase involved in cell wall biosynthesis